MKRRYFNSPRARACGLCLMAALSSWGCGSVKESVPDLVPVSGKVTYQGKALADASITFVPADAEEEPTELGRILRPAGKTDAEGAYELAWGEQAGAPPGKYNVMITAFKPSDDDDVKPESLIPEQYTSPKTSGLTRNVKDGENVFDFDLSINPAPIEMRHRRDRDRD
jgi:hypothetical protein